VLLSAPAGAGIVPPDFRCLCHSDYISSNRATFNALFPDPSHGVYRRGMIGQGWSNAETGEPL
jgi:hypothetical protein